MSIQLLVPAATAFDPRAVCNLILDEADRNGRQVTNLALQKLLYFAHGLYLVDTTKPLVTGFFEAWRYGPVHPTAYHAFKCEGADPIRIRADIRDPFGGVRLVPACTDQTVTALIRRIVSTYGAMTAGRLVEVSHAKNGPWAHIVNEAGTKTILGLRIPDHVISSLFKHHKVSVGLEPRNGEPREEVPLM